MAIWVKIRKLFEGKEVGYYKIYSQDYKTIEFYMGINRAKQQLEFYLTQDFTKPIKIIDCIKKDELLGALPDVNEVNYMKAISKGLKILKAQGFPESLDFTA